jgi:hypothetical protein
MTRTEQPNALAPSRAHARRRPSERWLMRALALSGVAFAVLSMIGNLVIGDFPDANTSTGKLIAFYGRHHASIAHGGMLLGYATIFFAFFGVALWARIRSSSAPAILAAAVLMGAAMVAVDMMIGADTYLNLGQVSTKANIAPAALQALHIGGAVGGTGADTVVFLLAIAAAGILSRALPGWLAWSALVLAIMHLTPLGFLAYLLFHLWALLAGIFMTFRPTPAPAPDRP